MPAEARDAPPVEEGSDETTDAAVLIESWDGVSIDHPQERSVTKRKSDNVLTKMLK